MVTTESDAGATTYKIPKMVTTESDAGATTYKIPSHADFLIAYR